MSYAPPTLVSRTARFATRIFGRAFGGPCSGVSPSQSTLRWSGNSSSSWRSFGQAAIPRNGSADADNFSLNRTAANVVWSGRAVGTAAGYFKRYAIEI